MKKIFLLMVFAGILICGPVFAVGTELKPQCVFRPFPQEVCPVMGGKIDKNVYIDFQAQRIYLCCPGCKETFLKDTEKIHEKIC